MVSLVNLGCAKNWVDSERLLGGLAEAGFRIAAEPADSDLCLVNTCGFIREAREETAATLRELSALKAGGRPKVLVALGCMVERAADAPELAHFLAHADARVGFRDYARLPALCRELAERARERGGSSGRRARAPLMLGPAGPSSRKEAQAAYAAFLSAPRLRLGAVHTAYLKISEGCSNPCRFCAIPRMRGPQVSRPLEELVAEARELVTGGARELNLIAQDTTSYGRDLYGRPALAELLRALDRALPAEVWLRLLYAYPKSLTAEMLDVLAGSPRFCPYIDLPLQHIADPILARMARGVTQAETRALLDLIVRKLPRAALRTAFIVGYPGETAAHFAELLAFVREGRFNHAGVFLYSPEPRTAEAGQAGGLSLAEKKRRRDALMRAQLEVSRAKLRARVGERTDVLVDGPLPAGLTAPPRARAVGRSQFEAPEVDGVIFLADRPAREFPRGERLKVKIVEALDYDLLGEWEE